MARRRRRKRFNPLGDQCYMCEAAASSDEHVPPESFFPARYQGKRLMSVPSCERHNHRNSTDVEYVRNILAVHYGTNAVAAEVAEVAKRSWDHSEKLFNRTFEGFQVAEVETETRTEETAVFQIDLPRVERIAAAIAHALFYLETRRQWFGEFEIFCDFHTARSLQGLPDGTESRGRWFASRPYVPRETPFPDVFAYRVHESDELVFAMNFYERHWIYARRTGRVVVRPPRVVLA